MEFGEIKGEKLTGKEKPVPSVNKGVTENCKKAAVGFEPTNNGFAIRRLNPLGHAAGLLHNHTFIHALSATVNLGHCAQGQP